jgi:hypothetical protein
MPFTAALNDVFWTYLTEILLTIGCCVGLYVVIVIVPRGRKEDLIGESINDRIRETWESDDAA